MPIDYGSMLTKRLEFFEDLVDVIARELTEHGISASAAAVAASAAADRVADHWGGMNLTIPRDFARKLTQRELVIYEDWQAGMGWTEMGRKHEMCDRSVRRAIKRIRAKLKAARADAQLDMLDTEPAAAGQAQVA